MPDIAGTAVRDTINAGAGVDTISGRDGSDSVFGGAGDDLIYGHSVADSEAGSHLIDALRVASGLSGPLFAASPPGDPNRLFIVEQHTGRIRILDLNTNQLQADHFLDLPDNSLAAGNEQGLLGLAFHPNYAANGQFYVNLTNAAGDTEIREYRRADANHADIASSRMVLTFDQPFANHNGGWMAFGPDGFLYIATGDGGSGGDPMGNAQNTSSLLGKILRIDVNGDAFPADATRNYAIPAGNPFAGAAPGADEVWLYGLRNPWRPSFDTSTGALYLGDVGGNGREEVDYVAPGVSGLNFGWPHYEGFPVYRGAAEGMTAPILDYDRTTPLYSGFAVTGGYVYHGPGGAQGQYVFADYLSGNFWTTHVVGGQAQDFLNRNEQMVVDAGDLDFITSFATDGRGRLYVIGQDGDIHRITPREGAGDGADYLRGDEGNDRIFGGVAFDDINGNMGDDTASGGLGADWVVGGKDQDLLFGDEGGDLVYGNLGDDTCDGGAGADIIRGGQGQDSLTGGAGDDFLSGDRGDDTVSGGAGADIFHGSQDAGLDRVVDFRVAEGDRVQLDPGTTYATRQAGADVVIDMGGANQMVLVGVQLAALPAGWIFGA